MTLKTKASHSAVGDAHPHPRSPSRRKLSIHGWVATVFGVGYIPVAPGTWGALVGVILYWGLSGYVGALHLIIFPAYFQLPASREQFVSIAGLGAIAIAAAGVWSSDSTAKSAGVKDPQFVVIDEVSGQFLTYLIALSPANWKYLLLGFILFRAFDIWKPFPARQAESLPGGWGIMTDDWIAGVYAGAGLWIARGFGL
jgi:phosphatidylglycerophosphatase A